MKIFSRLLAIAITLSTLNLLGCAAVHTSIKKSDLDIQTQMSATVWLDPVEQAKKTVYVQVRNTTGKKFDLTNQIKPILEEKGYRIVTNPDTAHYWLQANALKLEKMDLREAQGYLDQGYQGAAAGAAVGALASSASGGSYWEGGLIGGLVGGTVGLVTDALVEDINYTMVTDVMIVEKTDYTVTNNLSSNIQSGTSNFSSGSVTTEENKKRTATRVVSNANQVNLEFEEAKEPLLEELVTAIGGIF